MGGVQLTSGTLTVLQRLGEELKIRKTEANIGAHNGELTSRLVAQGVYCNLYSWKADPDQQPHNLPATTNIVDCLGLAQSAKASEDLRLILRDIPSDDLAKAMRTVMMISRSRAAVFFSGGQGTNALLDAFITANVKGRSTKLIALVGWSNESVQTLSNHMNVAIPLRERTWLRTFNFSPANVDELIEFLFTDP